jgi:hypothetical protein
MGRKKSKANYFTKETEDYIVKYNESSDHVYRAEIFTKHIYLPFYKLVENIIHTYKFYYTDVENIEDLKHEIVSVLIEEKIDKFDPTRGAKAYSYFGTIVKRWLINYNDKNFKKLKQVGSFDEMDDSYDQEFKTTHPDAINLSQLLDIFVNEMYSELEHMFPKENERKIADAVLTIFQQRNDIEIFKKKALYIYIREMTGQETPQLTKVINRLKEHFYEIYYKYYETGMIDTKPY